MLAGIGHGAVKGTAWSVPACRVSPAHWSATSATTAQMVGAVERDGAASTGRPAGPRPARGRSGSGLAARCPGTAPSVGQVGCQPSLASSATDRSPSSARARIGRWSGVALKSPTTRSAPRAAARIDRVVGTPPGRVGRRPGVHREQPQVALGGGHHRPPRSPSRCRAASAQPSSQPGEDHRAVQPRRAAHRHGAASRPSSPPLSRVRSSRRVISCTTSRSASAADGRLRPGPRRPPHRRGSSRSAPVSGSAPAAAGGLAPSDLRAYHHACRPIGSTSSEREQQPDQPQPPPGKDHPDQHQHDRRGVRRERQRRERHQLEPHARRPAGPSGRR